MRSMQGAALITVFLIVACTTKPVSRLDAYVGPGPQGTEALSEELTKRSGAPFEAVLLVVNDTSDQDSAPALTEQGMAFLTDQVTQRVEDGLPIQIVKRLTPSRIVNGQTPPEVARIGREQRLPHMLLAVFANVESEVPVSLPLTGDLEQGGGRPAVQGFEMRTNALAELALIESETGQVLARSDGRAWTRLNRLYVPVQSNAYPVIHRSLRPAPIFPKEENAKDITRSLAGDEALEQAVMHLQEIWSRQARP
ncbi:MAG: hypothetical protein NW703_17650 [Nitrospiraceae bacterium]